MLVMPAWSPRRLLRHKLLAKLWASASTHGCMRKQRRRPKETDPRKTAIDDGGRALSDPLTARRPCQSAETQVTSRLSPLGVLRVAVNRADPKSWRSHEAPGACVRNPTPRSHLRICESRLVHPAGER